METKRLGIGHKGVMTSSDLPTKPRLFVSYSHDSEAHKVWVRGLVERLRANGFEVPFDQDQEMAPERWPAWCKERVDEAEFVLVVCTPTYRDRFNDTETLGMSYGVKWEGHILYNELAWLGGRNYRIVPVLPPGGRAEHVPSVIRRTRRYEVEREDEHAKLVAVLRDEERRRMLARWREWTRRRQEHGRPLAVEEDFYVMPMQPEELLSDGIAMLTDKPPPSMLLTARYRVVEFVREARQREWNLLERWCDGGGVRVLLFHGPGGAGKTRLMQEWCIELRKRSWVAGFVPHRVSKEKEKELLTELLADRRPVLLVVDYAESKLLDAVLEVAHEQFQSGRQIALRVGLVARNAGDWWKRRKEHDSEQRVLLERDPPVEFQSITVEDPLRQRLFAAAYRAFSQHRGVEAAPPEIDLDDERFERVLYLHAAALAHVERLAHGDDAGVKLSASDHLSSVLGHEQAFWLKRWPLLEEDLDAAPDFLAAARRTIGALTLRGGVPDPETARAVMEATDAPRQPEDRKTHRRFERLCRTLYPGQTPQGGDAAESEAQYIGPLEPDLLGETLVELIVQDETVDDIERGFVGATEQAWETGFTVLGRVMESAREPALRRVEVVADQLLRRDVESRGLAATRAAVAVSSRAVFSRMSRLTTTRLTENGSARLASQVEALLPNQTLSLAALGVWSTARQLAGATSEDRARLLNNLGIHQSELGQPEQAFVSMAEAIDIRRKLAKKRPDAFLPDLAMSLNNLGPVQSALGQREQALASTAEAVDIRRKLAKERPDAFLPNLAMSLNNLSPMQSALGQREQALASAAEAVDIRRKLAKEQPDAFLQDLATSLNNLGNSQSELGQRAHALASTAEAVDIRRKLAKGRPDTFLPALAASLNNLGNRQSELGQRERAIASEAEAVDIRRKLAKERPDAFLPDLASSLNNLGAMQSKLGQREQALESTAEAVELYRQFFDQLPKAFANNFMVSLQGYLQCLNNVGRSAESDSLVLSAIETLQRHGAL